MSDKPASPARGRKKTAPPAQQPPQEEVVVRLPLADLYPFPDHPFQVRDDEEMRETIQSVKEYGVIVPAIVRPREEGGYEIVAGHRRKYACEQAGLDTMPVLIRNLDRDAATIIMVDSNLQRENILPSERAKAYKMKLEAIKRQGARNDLTSPKISAKLRSDDEIGQQMGVSGDTVRNYISLTNLVPELMQMVDEKKIALSPAYQIAALKPEEQQMVIFGGLGNTVGSFIGAISLSILPEALRDLAQYRQLIYGVLLVLLMMVKPQGLLGDINFKYIRQRMEHREKSKEAANE